jgi:hypothetical protein
LDIALGGAAVVAAADFGNVAVAGPDFMVEVDTSCASGRVVQADLSPVGDA